MESINNSVCRKAVELVKGFTNRDLITAYHIFYGYASLLDMIESMKQALLDENEMKDLNTAAEFFSEKSIDAALIKNGFPYLFTSINSLCEAKQIAVAKVENGMDSYKILSSLYQEEDEILKGFKKGKTISDVFALSDQMKEKAEKFKANAETEEVASHEEESENDSSSKSGEIKDSENKDKEEKSKSVTETPEEKRKKFKQLTETFRKLRSDLLNVVKGQYGPVTEFVQGCYQGSVLKSGKKRKTPKATFLFVGPPGVGKSLLAQSAAECLGLPCATYNMSEYNSVQSYEGLIGVSSIYSTAEEGRLVRFVRENPECILIFDEIEKAHRNTIQIFLQILDFAVADNVFRKEKTSFEEAIIIFTSNACKSIYENSFGNISNTPKNVILDALKNEKDPLTNTNIFPESICSRIAAGNVILFNHLGIREMAAMVNDTFDEMADQVENDYGYKVSMDHRLSSLFMMHHGGLMDARIASRQSDNFIKNELFELSRQMESHPELLEGVNNIRFEIGLSEEAGSDEKKEIKALFEISEKIEIGVICREEDRHYFVLPEKYNVHFATDIGQFKKMLDAGLTMVMIDLMMGVDFNGFNGVSLDDYHSIGLEAFNMIEKDGCDTAVYLIESERKYVDTDLNLFFSKGAEGVVSLLSYKENSVQRHIERLSDAVFLTHRSREFSKKGYVLDFNTAQVVSGDTLVIKYHDLKKVQAIDTDSSSAILLDAERPTVGFDDVIGAENAKQELRYFINYLSNPRKFINDGGKPAKGVLLYGPPGTGKTMLARAMAGESNVTFIQTSATEFLNKWFGQSEQNVRDIFRRAKKYAPSIIFIDEIDAIGKTRTGESRHTESVLNALLTELDGFKTDIRNPVFVIAATNYSIESNNGNAMSLDPALVRRFDNRILVDLPNEKERTQYLSLAVKNKKFVSVNDSVIKNVAARTPGVSIAILQNILDLAFRNANKENRLPDDNDLLNALEEYNFGEKREWSEEYYRSVAVHEAGHAYIAVLSGEKPSYITIESRGDFGGYMAHKNSEDKPNFTREELIWRIRCALGGRAAEEVFFGKEASLNTGASSDLQNATQYAANILCDYGMMSGQMLAVPFKTILETPLAKSYLDQINQLLVEEMKNTVMLIEKGKDKVESLADSLLSNNHLTENEILEVLNRK